MKKIIAFGGSNSKVSINQQLALYAAHQLDDSEILEIDLNEFELPLFGVDLEAEIGSPANAVNLNAIIESADGLVISLAEHNGNFSAVFKNTLDWLSRIDQKVWKGKPMLLLATSPGARGGASVLGTAVNSFPHFGGNIVAQFSLPSFHENFSKEGLTNEDLKISLSQQVKLLQQAL